MNNGDIYRAAQGVIEEQGVNAVIHAARRADRLMEAGDFEGCRLWIRILEAVHDLQCSTEGPDVPVH